MFGTKLYQHCVVVFNVMFISLALLGVTNEEFFPVYLLPIPILVTYLSYKTNFIILDIDARGILLTFSFFKKRIEFCEIKGVKVADIIDLNWSGGVRGFYLKTKSNRRYVILYDSSTNAYEIIKAKVDELKSKGTQV